MLDELLREAGCPEERIRDAITPVLTYKVNQLVLKQLAGANPDYRAAIELAHRSVEVPWRVSVKE